MILGQFHINIFFKKHLKPLLYIINKNELKIHHRSKYKTLNYKTPIWKQKKIFVTSGQANIL